MPLSLKNINNFTQLKKMDQSMWRSRVISRTKNTSHSLGAPAQYAECSGHFQSRILYIIIRKDKTLVCAFEDNFKQNGVNFYRSSASEHGQNITNITMIFKNQLCRFIDMYIEKIFWPTAPCRGCPEKEIWVIVGSCSVRFLNPLCLNPFTVCCIKLSSY